MKVPENFLFYLSAHEQCTEKLLAKAKDLTAEDLEISPESEIIRIRKMVYSVRTEIHRMKGFVRLKPLGAHVLYGYLKPKHKIGCYIAKRLARRNPGVIIALGSFKDGGDAEGIWDIYYQSQYCPERRNVAAFHRRMPRKALASAGSMIERNKNRKTLDDFFSLE